MWCKSLAEAATGHYGKDDLNSEAVFVEFSLQPVHVPHTSGNYFWD